jgi:hypothetical protein
MITWTAKDADGKPHVYTAARLGVMNALEVRAQYETYKAALLHMGGMTPSYGWMPLILWSIPGAHAFRDGIPLTSGLAELTYSGANFAELQEAAEERAKAEGFFDSWMRRITSRRQRAEAVEETPKPAGSSESAATA